MALDYKIKIRDRWNTSILRNVVPTRDFSIPSEENIGDTHKKLAKTKRANENNLMMETGQMMIEGGGGAGAASQVGVTGD